MATKPMNVKFHCKAQNNEHEFYEANVTVDYDIDQNYGADADGNRGVERLFINEITVQNCIDSKATLVELPLSENMMDEIWGYVWENFSE